MYIFIRIILFCSFGRSIAGNGDRQDFDLDNEFYVLFGVSDGSRASGALTTHTTGGSNPSISEEQFNVVNDTGIGGGMSMAISDASRRALIRAHGIFMLVAWWFFANCGIAFAGYMRMPLPNGEWFQVHRAFMIVSLFLALLGFMFAFISQANSSPPGLVDLGEVSCYFYSSQYLASSLVFCFSPTGELTLLLG